MNGVTGLAEATVDEVPRTFYVKGLGFEVVRPELEEQSFLFQHQVLVLLIATVVCAISVYLFVSDSNQRGLRRARSYRLVSTVASITNTNTAAAAVAAAATTTHTVSPGARAGPSSISRALTRAAANSEASSLDRLGNVLLADPPTSLPASLP
jgi:hypothetical protein